VIPTPIVAGNWKLHNGPAETTRFFAGFLPRLVAPSAGSVAIFPPAVSLTTARDALADHRDVLLGVQNVFWETKGAFTGEISPPMAREAGATLVLVGHSERRHVFGESDEETARKVRASLDADLIPVLCVGETAEERDAGRQEEVVERQISALSDLVAAKDGDRLVVAYEPVWAIGTGRTATPEDASRMHRHVRKLLRSAFPSTPRDVPILYGGSVKSENARALLQAPALDGLLIGGASLDPVGFAEICSIAATL
jgi:triosephosphate isomerase (TIM)